VIVQKSDSNKIKRGCFMSNFRKNNGEGSVRKLSDGSFECVIQSKYINPKTGNPKRIKRKGISEDDARKKAKLAVRAWEKEYEKGRDTRHSKTKTFGQYMDEFIETEVKKNITASGYHSYISTMNKNFYPFSISKLQLHMLNAEEFKKYYDEISKQKSKKTCLTPRQLCIRCCKWLMDRSLIEENYASVYFFDKEVIDDYDDKKAKKERERKKIFTSEDIQKFYYAYKNNMGEYPPLVLFLLETGLRAGEVAALRNDNIDLEKGIIWVRETQSLKFKDNDKNSGKVESYTKVPKNTQERMIIMSDLCKEVVMYMQEQTKLKCKNNPDNLLYPSFRSGKRRSNSSMEACFKDLCDKLEIDRDVRVTPRGNMKGLCLHSLRHTMDSIANSSKGANVVNTALMLGHSVIRTEEVYTHSTIEGLKSITTPSQAVLGDYRKEDTLKEEKELNKANTKSKDMSDEDKELYEMYLKLKNKFGEL
jgi:integrase